MTAENFILKLLIENFLISDIQPRHTSAALAAHSCAAAHRLGSTAFLVGRVRCGKSGRLGMHVGTYDLGPNRRITH